MVMSRQDERGWNVTARRAEASEGWPEAYVGWSVVCRVWMEREETVEGLESLDSRA